MLSAIVRHGTLFLIFVVSLLGALKPQASFPRHAHAGHDLLGRKAGFPLVNATTNYTVIRDACVKL